MRDDGQSAVPFVLLCIELMR